MLRSRRSAWSTSARARRVVHRSSTWSGRFLRGRTRRRAFRSAAAPARGLQLRDRFRLRAIVQLCEHRIEVVAVRPGLAAQRLRDRGEIAAFQRRGQR